MKLMKIVLISVWLTLTIFGGASLFAEPMKVYKVTDGDTIKFINEENKIINCRMAYIDTPESGNNPKMRRDMDLCNISLPDAKYIGLLSTSYTKRYFETRIKNYPNSPIEVEIVGVDQKNKRYVCLVEMFNYNIVKDGYAVPYLDYTPLPLQKDFINLRGAAQAQKLGLWKPYYNYMQCLDLKNKNRY